MAVQVEPSVDSDGFQHLKLKYDELLSSFTFNINLSLYGMVNALDKQHEVGRCRFTLSSPR
jgi:hypothetical protein